MRAPHSARLLAGFWLSVGPGAHAHSPHDNVRAMAVSPSFATDGTILVSAQLSEDYLAISTDGGRSWTHLGTPLAHKVIGRLAFSPAYAVDGTVFAAARNSGVWKSVDGGWTWSGPFGTLPSPDVRDVAVSPGYAVNGVVLAATAAGLARSTNGGSTWTTVMPGVSLTAVAFASDAPDTAFAAGDGLWRSTDGGVTWTALAAFPSPPKRLVVSPAFETVGTLAACFDGGALQPGVLASTDGGVSFLEMSAGLTDPRVNDVGIAGDGTMYAVSDSAACFRADSALQPWSLFEDGFEVLAAQTNLHYTAVAVSPSFSADGLVFVGGWEGFFASSDRGETWEQSELYHLLVSAVLQISPAFAQDGRLYAGIYGGGPYLWEELTNQWTALGTNVEFLFTDCLAISPTFAIDQTLLYGRNGLWKSSDAGASWTLVTPIDGGVVRAVEMSPSFAFDGVALMNRPDVGGTLRSTDGGASWTLLPDLMNGQDAIGFSPDFATDATIFAAGDGEVTAILRSTDGGDTWEDVSGAVGTAVVTVLLPSPSFATDDIVLAGTRNRGLYLSTNRGASWTPLAGGPSGARDQIVSIAFSPDWTTDETVYAVSFYDGVLRSADAGSTWLPMNAGLPPDPKRSIAISPDFGNDMTLYVATNAWTYRSTDGGMAWWPLPGYVRANDRHQAVHHGGSWQVHSDPQDYGHETTASQTAGAWEELEFYGGRIAWIARCDDTSGLANVLIDGELFETIDLYSPETEHQHEVFARSLSTDWHLIRVEVLGQNGGASTGNWVRSDGFEYLSILGDGTVGAEVTARRSRSLLEQSRPNPSRPGTTIRYTLDQRTPVRLTIYDVRGSVVRVLADCVREGGSHRETWDGRDDAGRPVASGTYFYEIRAGAARESRKMILLR